MSARYDSGETDVTLSTSLARVAHAAAAAERRANKEALAQLGYMDATHALPRFDIWAEGTYTTFDDGAVGTDTDGRFGLLYLGAEHRLRPNLLVGVLGQFDWMEEEDDDTGIGADGTGWMAGPYIVGRLGGGLYIQARGAWGMSENSVTPFGTYTDSFDTTRWLASGKVEGRFLAGNWRVSPTAGLVYFQENQEPYVDSNGLTIPGQTVSLGRVTVGPEVGYRVVLDDGGYMEPSLGVTGVWDFDEEDKSLGGLITSSDAMRARVTGGLAMRVARGAAIEASGFYDGLGDKHFEAYGGKLKIFIPLR